MQNFLPVSPLPSAGAQLEPPSLPLHDLPGNHGAVINCCPARGVPAAICHQLLRQRGATGGADPAEVFSFWPFSPQKGSPISARRRVSVGDSRWHIRLNPPQPPHGAPTVGSIPEDAFSPPAHGPSGIPPPVGPQRPGGGGGCPGTPRSIPGDPRSTPGPPAAPAPAPARGLPIPAATSKGSRAPGLGLEWNVTRAGLSQDVGPRRSFPAGKRPTSPPRAPRAARAAEPRGSPRSRSSSAAGEPPPPLPPRPPPLSPLPPASLGTCRSPGGGGFQPRGWGGSSPGGRSPPLRGFGCSRLPRG